MRRALVHLSLMTALSVALAGCGGDDGDDSDAADAQATTSASASASASASPVSGSCEPPTRDVKHRSGSASLDVTSGPDEGQAVLFVDSSHTACTVELPSLGAEGVQGTFSCTGLTGGGEDLERDAEGSFTLLP